MSTTSTAPATPIRSKAASSNDGKRACVVAKDACSTLSVDALEHFELASARATNYARTLEMELQMTRDQLADAMRRLEAKHGVISIDQEIQERKERDRKRPPPANVCLDVFGAHDLLKEYAQYIQYGTDGKGSLILTVAPPTDDPSLALKLFETLRTSVRLAQPDETGIVLYGPHRGANVKIVGKEADDTLIARSIGSHVGTTLAEEDVPDKWTNNQTVLLEPHSVGRSERP